MLACWGQVCLQKLKYLPEQLTRPGLFVKLRLEPGSRRHQQSSLVTGTGTLLIGQEFLFQVDGCWSVDFEFSVEILFGLVSVNLVIPSTN